MKKVLILTGRYLPGFKDGGPVRSIVNLVDTFGDRYDIRIMCMDRDHGDTEAYPNVCVYDYNEVNGAKVFYVPPQGYSLSLIKRLADEVDVVYCCGPYNDYVIKVCLLNRMGLIKSPLVVAPMGSFSPEAYAIKSTKKKLFMAVMKTFGLFKKIIWSVTSDREDAELKAVLGQNIKTIIAEDLPRKGMTKHSRIKREGQLKLIFMSRISPKKNLLLAAQILQRAGDKADIEFDIYGNMEDPDYYAQCEAELNKLPQNIKWEYKGLADSDAVPGLWAQYDAFLFPTRGENYGHVIAEAMSAGCVPIISDQTPWMDLEDYNCGYVKGLDDMDGFAGAIDELVNMAGDKMAEKSQAAQSYITEHNKNSIDNSGYLKIFEL